MKKNILIITILFMIIYLLFKYNNIISITTISSSYLFLSKVLPFLLPIFIISKILINYNFAYYISSIFKNNIYIYILLISFISGCPNNVITIKDLLKNNVITIKEANIYLKSSFFQSPLFLYTMLKTIFNNDIAITIIVIELITNVIIFIINPIKKNNIIKIKSKSFNDILITSIKESCNVMINIYITIIIFNIIISLLPKIFSNFIGIIEVTQGLNYLVNSNSNTLYKLILSVIYISFGGLSIHTQVNSILQNSNIDYKYFLNGRIMQVIIALILLITFYCYARNFNWTFTNIS
ncbi:MAG: hypothetical protein IJ572_02250 [Bacilli bacterium]|nr:hypothetical protein [Bacilli bacterium]